jgi:hypothetical protein
MQSWSPRENAEATVHAVEKAITLRIKRHNLIARLRADR